MTTPTMTEMLDRRETVNLDLHFKLEYKKCIEKMILREKRRIEESKHTLKNLQDTLASNNSLCNKIQDDLNALDEQIEEIREEQNKQLTEGTSHVN